MNSKDQKFSKLPPKQQLEAVKAAQPQIVLEVGVRAFDNGQLMVVHPDTEDPLAIAQFIDMLITGAQVLCRQKLATQDQKRIIPVRPGVRLQG